MSYGGGYGGGRGGGGGGGGYSNGYDNHGGRNNYSSGYSNGYENLRSRYCCDVGRFCGFGSRWDQAADQHSAAVIPHRSKQYSPLISLSFVTSSTNECLTEAAMAMVAAVVVMVEEAAEVMSMVTPAAVVTEEVAVDTAVVVLEVIACLTSVPVFRSNSGVS